MAVFSFLLMAVIGLIAGIIYQSVGIVRSFRHYKWRKISRRNVRRLLIVLPFSAFLIFFLYHIVYIISLPK